MTASQITEVNLEHFAETTGDTVPVGYKLTEVGVIPEDWEVKTYGEIFTFLSTSTNSRADLSTEGDLGYVHYGDIHTKWNNKLDLDDCSLPRISSNLISSASIIDGDLIMADASEDYEGIGKSVEVFNVGDKRLVAGLHTILLRDKDRMLADGFRGYLNSIPAVKRIFDRLATGMKVYGISKNNLATVCVPVPSKVEQTAIANALSDVDALISELEKLIAKKQAIKTATMQQLLTGRTRLPQFALREDGSKKGYNQSELGEIPEDWEVVKLADIGKTIIGLTYSLRDVAEHGTLVLRSSNVQNGKLAYADNVYVNMGLPERVIAREGDILICVRNGSRQLIGKCALIDKKTEGSAFGAFMSIFRTRHSAFTFYQFQSDLIQNQINEIMGATINQITNKDMSGFMITLPLGENEQTAIATILSDMDSDIQTLEQRLNKTRYIKQGMMQELLTGKTRLMKGKKHD